MSSHLLMLDAGSSAARRAGAVHAEGLDAWLGTDTCPVEYDLATGADIRSVGLTTDWTAPCRAVDLTCDTAGAGLPSSIRPILQEGSRRLMFDVQAYEILVRVAS